MHDDERTPGEPGPESLDGPDGTDSPDSPDGTAGTASGGETPPEDVGADAVEASVDGRAERAESDALAEATAAVASLDAPDQHSPRAETCPFFRRVDENGQLGASVEDPDASNRCVAIGEPQAQSMRQQELVCLQAAHVDCPRYLRGKATETESIPPTEVGERRIPRATIAATLILVASAVAAFTFVLVRGGISLPVTGVAGSSPTPSRAAALSPTPTATVAPTFAPTVAPTTEPTPTTGPTIGPTPFATPAPTSRPIPASTPEPSPAAAPTTAPFSPSATSDRYALLVPCSDKPACFIYTVRTGDNLRSIANYFGVPYSTVLLLNPAITDASLISKGDRIVLPPPTR